MSLLTAIEQRHVRSALRLLRARMGSWDALVRALRSTPKTIRKLMSDEWPVTPEMAFRVARVASASIDDLLAGRFPPPGTCPHCGRSADESPAFTDEETFVE